MAGKIWTLLYERIASFRWRDRFADNLTWAFREIIRTRSSKFTAERAKLSSDISREHQRIDALLELFTDNEMSKTLLERKSAGHERRIALVEAQQAELSKRKTDSSYDITDMIQKMRQLPDIYAAAPPEGKAEILRSIASEVTVTEGGELRVEWGFQR